MAQGRGGATQASLAIGLMMIALLLLNGELAKSKEFTVGDDLGWDFNVNNWPKDKTFHAGDILEFNYQKEHHNLVKVESDDYENCKSDNAIITFSTGKDRITLVRGTQYFICGIAGHCRFGNMKINVTAL